MQKEGTIRLERVSLEWLDREENKLEPVAISDNGHKLVPIIHVDKEKSILRGRHDDGKETELDLNSKSLYMGSDLSYLVVQYRGSTSNGNGSISIFPKIIIIDRSAWQFILDNYLVGSKIEFDDSQEILTTFTYYKKPDDAGLTKVFKIKMILFQSYFSYGQDQQASSYLDEDYSTYDEAEKALPEKAKTPGMDIDNNRQCYFTIEGIFKRKEYEKKIYKG